MHKPLYKIVLLFSLALSLILPAFGQEQTSVEGQPIPGFPLFVRVLNPNQTTTVEYCGLQVPLTIIGNTGYTIVPTPAHETNLTQNIIFRNSGGAITHQRTVHLSPKDYGHRNISIPPETLEKYLAPKNKADNQHVQDVTTRITSQFYPKSSFLPATSGGPTSPFGARRTYNGWYEGWHKGGDYAGGWGAPIYAPAAGIVREISTGVVNGNMLFLDHGLGMHTVYFHAEGYDVLVGQSVTNQTQIGRVGGTGGFAPHLHLELRIHGVPQHPTAGNHLPRSWINI